MRQGLCATVAAVMLGAGLPGTLAAQGFPSEPLVFGDGRVTLSGGASVTFSCSDSTDDACGDDAGFFNYSDYEHSTLRTFRLNLNAAVRANRHVAVLTEVRSDNGEAPTPYALYVRVRPWATRDFDIQAGRIPPVFGAFGRRDYAADNILIGYPLGYQYLSSLRTDAVPANADELLRMRGRGWLSNFSLGNPEPLHGLPLASGFRWDTGVEVHGGVGWAEAAVAVTTGSLAHPLVGDDNNGRHLAGRVAFRPVPGLIAGVSGSRAAFLTREAAAAAGDVSSRDFPQTAFGIDAEYSRDYYLLRFETIHSRWHVPTIAAPLNALSTVIEGRYRFRPGWHAAARFDHLGFSEITGTGRTDTWDANVTRVEAGAGYMIRRNIELKVSLQRNVRDGGRVRRSLIGATQAVLWF